MAAWGPGFVTSRLDTYRAKRRFAETPEPQGKGGETEGPIYVIQQHHARRMHYDLRLQVADTLKSWAVPEGPCLDPKVRRFAKLVEDHPLDYANFEGTIPKGNYGAGNVIVWDKGTWVTLEDAAAAIDKGELKFRLSGEKLSGGWMLKRLPDDPTNWLLIKERDIAARPLGEYDVLTEQPNSVISGRPVDAAPLPRQKAKAPKANKIAGGRKAVPFSVGHPAPHTGLAVLDCVLAAGVQHQAAAADVLGLQRVVGRGWNHVTSGCSRQAASLIQPGRPCPTVTPNIAAPLH